MESGEKRKRRAVLTHVSIALGWLVSIIGIVQWATPRSLPVYPSVTISACVLGDNSVARVFRDLDEIPLGQSKIFFVENLRLSFASTQEEILVVGGSYPDAVKILQCTDGPGYIHFLKEDLSEEGNDIASIVAYEDSMLLSDGVTIGSSKFSPNEDAIGRKFGCPGNVEGSSVPAGTLCSMESTDRILRVPVKQKATDRFVDLEISESEVVLNGTFIVTQTNDEFFQAYDLLPMDMARTSEYGAYRCTIFRRNLPSIVGFAPCVWPLTLMVRG
ncbi:MAG: hypothetical protein KF769_14945 [Parvibaculum sp.]|nr:hypothetical protein [Parvibaculum sp.]